VHGEDYPTQDGSCVRDFVHVSDLADAHLKAVQWLMRQKPGRGRHDVFNLGSGAGYSVKQVVQEIGRSVGQPVPHVFGARRPGDSPQLVGCIAKAQRDLGWTPLRGLETQIEDTVRWRRAMVR
jgi:UDP-glucose 4-epimerase